MTPDFQLAVSNSPLTTFSGQTGAFNGSANSLNGYSSSVALSCVTGGTAPPSTCTIAPPALTPGANRTYTVTVGGSVGDYNFNVQGLGADTDQTTHLLPLALHLVNFGLTSPSPASLTVARGSTSAPVAFQVTAAGSFNQSVTVTCTHGIPGATCNLTPGGIVNPTSTSPVSMTASVAVPAGAVANTYNVTIQATTAGAPAPLTRSFALTVTANPDFGLSEPSSFPEVNAGSIGTGGPISVTSQDGFAGTVALSCPTTYGAGSCSVSPASVNSFPATATLTINGTSFAAGSYSLSISGKSGSVTHSVTVPFNVGDYGITGTQTLSLAPGGQGTANLTLTSSYSYAGKITATCDSSALPGATCILSPANPINLASGGTTNLTVTLNLPGDTAAGNYHILVNTHDTTGAPNHSFAITLHVGQDFALTSSTGTQTVTAGQTTGPYNLTLQPVGSSFNGSVTLSCSALPAKAQCLFNPSGPITPGNSPAIVVMTISTTASTVAQGSKSSIYYYAMWLFPSMAMVVLGAGGCYGKGRPRSRGFPAMLFYLVLVLTSCGGVSSGGGGGGDHTGTPPGTYKITVTGTSSGISVDAGQSTQVTLVVN